MSWESLLRDGKVVAHKATRSELDELRGVVARNLSDAAIEELSDDNRFGLAYEAGLLLAKMVVTKAGYRIRGSGGHQTMLEALELAMGVEVHQMARYLDQCRRKRNTLSYDMSLVASSKEADELLEEVHGFKRQVERWIKTS